MPTPKKNTKTGTECHHYRLHFEQFGAQIVCSGCGYRWKAIGRDPNSAIFDVQARTFGLTETDLRNDPFGR